MPKTGVAYEKTSKGSWALIVCFSAAVVIMAGWLILMIMLSHDADTKTFSAAALPARAIEPAPRVESPQPNTFRRSSRQRRRH